MNDRQGGTEQWWSLLAIAALGSNLTSTNPSAAPRLPSRGLSLCQDDKWPAAKS